jgi:N,N'-diacetyllegionaminate synthase
MAMVTAIRNIERALGDSVKRLTESEFKNVVIARKSLIACKEIKAGEVFTLENVATKRPGSGISPMRLDDVLGKIARRDFLPDELIEL